MSMIKEKIDPYHHKERYEKWEKSPSNSNISKANNKLIIQYILDMEQGKNISRHSPKGARSYIRLNAIRQKISFIAELFEKYQKIKDISKVSEDNVHKLFNDMRQGNIKRLDGGLYKSTSDYTKIFKAFWHWYQRVNYKKGKIIQDITIELDTKADDPDFVYFTEEHLNEMIKLADPDMRVVLLFMYDTGMRVTEMKNIKVSDFSPDFKEVNIRNETSKTFGRRIKLMMCSNVVREYVKTMEIKADSYLFSLLPKVMNNRLNILGEKVLKKPKLSLLDIRHSSACYWYPRYPNIQGLLYRFGWKKLNMAHYYARFLGMEDTISEENMLLGVTKTELEKEMTKLKIGVKHHLEKMKKEAEFSAEVLRMIMQNIPKDLKVKITQRQYDKQEVE